ncbi:MAG: DUF2723 domain-containing protein [Bacteroidales bacterium]|jgi:hypothetical protein|nr:DUF2723 domain-containing protein [Bacteroidales bacterium]
MKKYSLVNNISGWAVFAVSAITYLLTIEPTASLWDCGEYIASGFKLEVGHPPGNPVFMIMTRFFTLFAMGNTEMVAATVNAMSALVSAFTILFLFWTITHLAKKLVVKNQAAVSLPETAAVMSAGIVGALACCFSDSFWFSAVEGEVYASSSFFTAIVFWAILKWEDAADEPYADRWLILIAFLMGLSIGVHLLNLLTLPAIVLVYYFRKYEFSWRGLAVSSAISVAALALLLYGIMPGIVTISSRFDMFFVNTLGMPSNSGMVFHVLLTAALLALAVRFSFMSSNVSRNTAVTVAALFFTGIWIISDSGLLNIVIFGVIAVVTYYMALRNKRMLNMAMTVIAVILIGYSSNAIIVIRSSANPPLNENNPSNPFNLLYFINREQYGDRPLFHGQHYNSPVVEYKDGKERYSLADGKYIVTGKNIERIYDPRFLTLFPRMWSDQPDHAAVYEEWGKVKGTPIQATDISGKSSIIRKPTFIENVRFMLSHQFGHMYFRYFMWNFAGRQNDEQGNGGALNGNWITGLRFLDEPRTGTYNDAPDDIKNNPSRNRYFLLPFILGLAGMFYHMNRDKRNWSVIMLLFVMTGIAIVLYLNQYPNQPRERDYAYTGSFYFFAVWIGLGVAGLYEALSKPAGKVIAAPLAGAVCLMAVPVIMAAQNWDDHDRSGRYLGRDVAFNYLNSCAPNAILFTNGDNDTFPLWYAQEVEGKRTDVRVCNLMLLNTDWYIDQMKRTTYQSAPLPVTLPAKKYYDGVNNQIFVAEKTQDPVDISTVIDWINSDNKATKVQVSATEILDVLPSRTIRIPVDADRVIASGTVKPEDRDKIVPYIDITLSSNSILKSQLIVLDILAHNKWERPIYFVAGYHNDAFGLEEYFRLEGLAYRLVPIKSTNKSWMEYGGIDTDILYNNMMNKFVWGGVNTPGVNNDYHHRRTLTVVRVRSNYARLAKALAEQGDSTKAVEVLDRCMELFPVGNVPYDPYFPDLIDAYFRAGATNRATEMSIAYKDYYLDRLNYYLKQKPYVLNSAAYEIQTAIQYTSRVAGSCEQYGKPELAKEINDRLEVCYTQYTNMAQPQTQRQ